LSTTPHLGTKQQKGKATDRETSNLKWKSSSQRLTSEKAGCLLRVGEQEKLGGKKGVVFHMLGTRGLA
jgi:hypothetical protein